MKTSLNAPYLRAKSQGTKYWCRGSPHLVENCSIGNNSLDSASTQSLDKLDVRIVLHRSGEGEHSNLDVVISNHQQTTQGNNSPLPRDVNAGVVQRNFTFTVSSKI